MPFTISHTAAVLPFSRFLARYQLLSAAVIGSMVPDFAWLTPWRLARFETHSAVSLVTFCLPIGLASYWVFQRLIKTPLIELLPNGAYSRWREFAVPAEYLSLRQWILAACGVLAGAVIHVVWDVFTHEGARGVRMIPGLDDLVVEIGAHHLAGARLLQDVSSLLGLIVVVAILAYGLRRRRGAELPANRPLPAGERHAWIATYVLLAAVLSGLFFLIELRAEFEGGLERPVMGAAIAVLRGLTAASLGVSACLQLRLGKQRCCMKISPVQITTLNDMSSESWHALGFVSLIASIFVPIAGWYLNFGDFFVFLTFLGFFVGATCMLKFGDASNSREVHSE
jgi:hypothetical protein